MSTQTIISNSGTGLSNGSAPRRAVDVADIGWMFVNEYYTFLNKQPGSLHFFYNAQSLLSYGGEGESVAPIQGQASILQKFAALDYQDCQVLVTNLDAQTSQNGGILLQVLGEMSNKSALSQKFVQTFFLAEQPTGYFVLNDILRFIKEDPPPPLATAPPSTTPLSATPLATAPAPPISTTATAVVVPTVESHVVVAAAAATANSAMVNQSANSVETEEEKVEEISRSVDSNHISPHHSQHQQQHQQHHHIEASSLGLSSETTSGSSLVVETTTTKISEKEISIKEEKTEHAEIESQPSEPVASAAKTWATLAAVNRDKWGSQVNLEAKGVTVTAVSSQSVKPSTGAAGGGGYRNGRDSPSSYRNNNAGGGGGRYGNRDEQATVCIKSLHPELHTLETLKRFLDSHHGRVKSIDVVPNKGLAFVEFESVELARSAIEKGTFRIEDEAVTVEEKKRPSTNYRGGGGGGRAAPSSGGYYRGGSSSGGGASAGGYREEGKASFNSRSRASAGTSGAAAVERNGGGRGGGGKRNQA